MRQLTIDEFFEMLEEAAQQQEAEEDQQERDQIEEEAYNTSPDAVEANPLYTNMYNTVFATSKSRFPTLEELQALTLASTLPPL